MEHSAGDCSSESIRLNLLLEGSIVDAPSRVEERGDDDCHLGIVLDFGRQSEDAFIGILYMERVDKPNRSSTCRCRASGSDSFGHDGFRCCAEC